jgi:TonB-linked SusC/RagA family outer membrane protein
MKKRLLARVHLLLVLLFLGTLALAQTKVISGKVTDAKDGTPLGGVSVMTRGNLPGTTTDAAGNFRITVPDSVKTLFFSFVGFTSKEMPANAGNLQVALAALNTSLNEVVVIGYGSTRKKDLTGSVATVTAKDFQKGSIASPEQLIAGKVPGVSIISNGGQPGVGSTIRIRGGASLSASNDPLIVIDGVPLDNDPIAGAGSPLSFINPNDVESFTILKDASATAIYGTRASNGVIIITTKKGRSDALRVNFNSVNSVSVITKKVSVLSGDQVRTIVNANGTAAQKAMLGSANTDWQEEIYRAATGTDNNINITGGIKKLPYRLSIGYQYLNGVLRTDHLQKTSAALALNPVFFNNHLKVDLNLKASLLNARFGNQAAIGAANSFDPTQPVYVKSKRYGGYFEWVDSTGTLVNLAGKNPLGLLEQRYDKSKPVRGIGNLQLDYKFHFLPDLRANLNMGFDASDGKGTLFINDSAAVDYTRKGRSTEYQQRKKNTVLEFYLNYVKEIKAIHSRVDVMAGYSYNDYLTKIYNYADYDAHGTKLPNSDPAFPYDEPRHTLISFFGRANYSFKDRYLLTATLRRDGSSRFSPNNRWALFPSVALAWKIKDEAFLITSPLVSDLKLRLGYGVTGQQDAIGNYDYLSYYSLSAVNAAYQLGNTYVQGYRPGGFYADRKWEQTATTNLGIDFGFFNSRITGSIDFYLKKTTDLLNKVPQPAGSNFSAYIIANVGDMENKGVEFSINTQPIHKDNFGWDVGFNITYNKNTITKLTIVSDTSYAGVPTGNIAGGIGGQFALIHSVGHPKNTFYLYQQVYDKSGKPIEGVFVDRNGDGIINQNDLARSKSADPKVLLGFTTNVSWGKWNAGCVMRASIGNYVYNNTYSQTGVLNQLLGNTVLYNVSSNYLTTQFKGSNAQTLLSDYYIQNGSFVRMDNLNISYNIGQIYHNKATLRINGTVQNVFVITKYTGLDPEIGPGNPTTTNTSPNTPGIDNNFYPRPRIFSLGLNLAF